MTTTHNHQDDRLVAFQDAAYALGRARGSLEVFRGAPAPP